MFVVIRNPLGVYPPLMATRRQLPPLQSAATEVEAQEMTPNATTPQDEGTTPSTSRNRRSATALTQPTNTLGRQEAAVVSTASQEEPPNPSLLMDDADEMIADDLAAFQQATLGSSTQQDAADRPSRSLAIQSLRSGTQRRDAAVGRTRPQESARAAIPTRETLAPQPRNLIAMAEADPAIDASRTPAPPAMTALDPQQVDVLASTVTTQVAQQLRSVETVLDGVNAQVTALPDTVQDLLQQVQDNTLAHLNTQMSTHSPQTAMAGVEEALAMLQAQQATQVAQLQAAMKRQALVTRLTCVAAIVAVVLGSINLVHIQELPRQIQQVQGHQDDTNRRLDQLKQSTRFIESHLQALTSKVQRALTPPAPVVPGDGPATAATVPTP